MTDLYQLSRRVRQMKKRKPKHRRKDDIQYGPGVGLTADDVKPEHTRIRISIMIPGDVIDALRKRAEAENIGYQTLINRVLAESVDPKHKSLLQRLDKLEDVVMVTAMHLLALGEKKAKKPHRRR